MRLLTPGTVIMKSACFFRVVARKKRIGHRWSFVS